LNFNPPPIGGQSPFHEQFIGIILTNMEFTHKHRAVLTVLVLIAIFLGICGIYWFTHRNSTEPSLIPDPNQTATSTASSTVPMVEKKKLEEHAAYYDVTAAYPSTTGLAGGADAAALTAMKGFEQNFIDGFKERGNFANLTAADVAAQNLGGDRKYALDIDYDTYRGSHTVSYVFIAYENSLGAHPNTYYRTFTFDTQTGAILALDDLFLPGKDYLSRVSKQTRADLPSILKAKAGGTSPDLKLITDGTQPQDDSFQNFAIDGTKLNMIFPPYQVAAYVYGATTDPIPLTIFKDILRPEYLPK
jgi:Protein of unknown function (DUF3298)